MVICPYWGGYAAYVLEASLVFSPTLPTVRDARHFLAHTLAGWGCDTYDFGAPVVVSELASNAALHAKTPYTLRLRLEATHLVVTVTDANPRLPQPRHYGLDATTGRGLNLVASLSSRWGAVPTADGKTVWAHVLPDESVIFDVTLDAAEDLGDQPPSSVMPPSLQEAEPGPDKALAA